MLYDYHEVLLHCEPLRSIGCNNQVTTSAFATGEERQGIEIMAAGPGAVVPAVLGPPPAAVTNGTQRDEKKSASKTVTDTIIGGAQSVSAHRWGQIS